MEDDENNILKKKKKIHQIKDQDKQKSPEMKRETIRRLIYIIIMRKIGERFQEVFIKIVNNLSLNFSFCHF